jgi:hypothetical protein
MSPKMQAVVRSVITYATLLACYEGIGAAAPLIRRTPHGSLWALLAVLAAAVGVQRIISWLLIEVRPPVMLDATDITIPGR